MRDDIPLDHLGPEAFGQFRQNHLDKGDLEERDLEAIARLCGAKSEEHYHVACDEYHRHGYRCVDFSTPTTAIVERLLNELASYKNRLGQVNKPDQ